jgi:phosphatidylinositol-3-phosphatase
MWSAAPRPAGRANDGRRAVRAARSAAACAVAALIAGCSSPAAHHEAATAPAAPARPSTSPHSAVLPEAPAHTLIVMLENHNYSQVIGSSSAPFLNALAHRGALFTNSRAITHPSQPNYLALFSGSTHAVGDGCPQHFTGPNLASELLAAGYTFAGYAEGLPATGSNTCDVGNYARRHVPWTNFSTVPPSVSKPFAAFPAGNFAALPTVSFVIPDLCHDMHDCSVGTGDAWVQAHLGPYANWAMTHHSLLIVDFDENDDAPANQIATIFYGQTVKPGRYGEPITHYSVLRTIENLYHLRPLGHAAHATPITNVWEMR